ncbi:MAG TPA: polysaccharide deacetylase family protein [Thermodesulfobacteriota bacterium]|nr:polysaccharide deacetylase family protein [Thermodesulfobacteriota bacterium]
MSRFHTATILLVLTALGAGLSLASPVRWLVLGLLLTAYLLLLTLGVSVLKLNFFVAAVCRGDSTTKRVALTFDDGPDPAATPGLLEVLRRHRVKATFFPIGTKVRDDPEMIKRIEQEGHIVGNHSFRHVWWMNFLMSRALDREIRMAQEAIDAAIGRVPAYFRPPMGLTNPHLRKALKRHGLSVIGWDVRPFDTTASAEKVIKRVLQKVRNGSIIALHDTGREPAELARLTDELVTRIREQKYIFCQIEELAGVRAYQRPEGVEMSEPALAIPSLDQSEAYQGRSGFGRFLARKLASTAYVRRAMENRVTLDACRTSSSPRFFFGVGLVLFSFLLGWPMVALFGVLSAYSHAPVLLLLGTAFYGFSHLVFMFGMYLAGPNCIKYADVAFSWILRKAVERALFTKRG